MQSVKFQTVEFLLGINAKGLRKVLQYRQRTYVVTAKHLRDANRRLTFIKGHLHKALLKFMALLSSIT